MVIMKIIWCCRVVSQLSLAIFIASRSYLGAQKCSNNLKMCSKLLNPWIAVHLLRGWHDILRQNMIRGVGRHGFRNFWHVWNYIRLFWVTRRFLRTVKITTESWECVLLNQKVWLTSVDLLGNISIPFSLARV